MTDHAELVRIQRAAEELLGTLVRGSAESIVRALAPRPEDYAKVFEAGAADAAQKGFAQLWSSPPKSLGKPEQTQVHAFAADAASLAGDNEYSRSFPGGYRKIAQQLRSGVVWVAWTVVAPGERDGMSFDGLVFLGDHWAWFPKPWRILGSEGN
jgi:hypothetical protein